MTAARYGHTEIVKMLLEQNGIDINIKNIYLISSMFQTIILYFEIIHGI